MNLELSGSVLRGEFALELQLTVPAGQTLALVGPNGAGKSTSLSVCAGLLALARGRLAVGGRVLDAPAQGVFVPPEARRIGWLPQQALLFPHRTVRDNVAYGPLARGMPAAAARARAEQWLERVGLAGYGSRRPHELSGGQAQRAALARTLAAEPEVLLLDEPLAAVDASARRELRALLHEHLGAFAGPRLLVTHDAVDAFVLADRIAVLEAGRVVQAGTAAELGSAPRSRYVADLVGLNFVVGTVHDSVFTAASGATLVAATPIEGAAVATVHPRAIALFRSRPDGSPRNVWQATVLAIEAVPAANRVRLGGPLPLVAEVTPAAVSALGLAVGTAVWVALKATEVQVAPA
jgi:molybdate transport system ATP-binding protein